MEYCRVKEKTKSGVDHYHTIIGNMSRGYTERYIRNVASRLWNDITGNSYVVDVRNTYGRPEKYLSKYMDKNMVEFPYDKGERRYSFSQGAMLPPRVVRNYQIYSYFVPSETETPYQQAFGDKAEFKRYHTEDIKEYLYGDTEHYCISPPSGGEFQVRQACHHEECELRLWHTPKQYKNFETSIGYRAAMEDYLEEREEMQKLFWRDDNLEYFNNDSN